jgi:hypothetical protein
MKLGDETLAKIFASFAVLALVIPIVFVLISLTLYSETHESCLRDCRTKYKFNVDNCWSACDERCNERFEK